MLTGGRVFSIRETQAFLNIITAGVKLSLLIDLLNLEIKINEKYILLFS